MSKQTIAVVGDLHYESSGHDAYVAARQQLCEHSLNAVFQLGDQGGYSHCGTWQSFEEGREFLAGFDTPFYTLIGNHDLEGPDYSTDEQAVAAWCRAFDMSRPYQS